MNTRIAITGGDGYVGNVVIRKLLKKGFEIKALIHTHQQTIHALPITLVRGDMRDKESLRALCEDCDAVFHLASYISIDKRHDKFLKSINIEGTQHLIDICKEKKIRMVYASSIEAIGKQGPHVHTEADGFNEHNTLIRYGWSKAIASKAVLDACKDGLDATIVCPSGILGPYDFGTSKLGIMVKEYLSKKLIAYPAKGGFCFVDVRDVADAVISAYTNAKSGTYYIVSAEYADVAHIMDLLHEASHIRKPLFSIPLWLMYVIAPFAEFASALTRKEVIFTRGSCNVLKSRLQVASSNITEDLKITPRALKESIADQIRWYRGEKVSLE